MQWRKHVRIKYGGRVGVGQGSHGDRKELEVRVLKIQKEEGGKLTYVCHQVQNPLAVSRSSAVIMLCCGRRKVSLFFEFFLLYIIYVTI